MKHLITTTFIGLLTLANVSFAQCVADYDFGAETLGVSPNPELGEQFDPGVIGTPYEDILHILLPEFVLDIDSTLPFFPPRLWTALHCPTSCLSIWTTPYPQHRSKL